MSGSTENSTWPLPRFSFSVTGMANNPVFQEVTGLDSDAQASEYRGGTSLVFSPIKMTGLVTKHRNVTLKKGIFVGDNDFQSWYSSVVSNTIKPCTITVHLLDQTGAETYAWVLHNALPVKVSGMDLKSGGNEVEVDSIEVIYESMTIS